MAKKKEADFKKSTEFRFFDREHHKLVKLAAKKAGLSMNAWITQVTLAAARKDLAA